MSRWYSARYICFEIYRGERRRIKTASCASLTLEGLKFDGRNIWLRSYITSDGDKERKLGGAGRSWAGVRTLGLGTMGAHSEEYNK